MARQSEQLKRDADQMTKDFILAEIKRTAAENGGTALGRVRFEKSTGITQNDWYGRYWSKWSDAVREAGCTPNSYQEAFDTNQIVSALARLVRELGHFPVFGELRLKARSDPSFPSHGVFARLGSKQDRVRSVIDWCAAHPGFDDVVAICQLVPTATGKAEKTDGDSDMPLGFVYLARMGKHYKIGRTASLGRREYELAIQLPEKLTLVHSIRTDDPAGIEVYWHNRFANRRGNGEWFLLSGQDVKAFKRRTFM